MGSLPRAHPAFQNLRALLSNPSRPWLPPDYGVFFSSSNLDGINLHGSPGLNYAQTGLILRNHDYLYRVVRNFVVFSQQYFEQDDACAFRINYIEEIKRQKDVIRKYGYSALEGKEMIYLGAAEDSVFELEITPFSDEYCTWTQDNPLCRYVDKLEKSRLAISFIWHNPKNSSNYEFIDILKKKITKAFLAPRMKEEALKSVLVARFAHDLDQIVERVNCGIKWGAPTTARHEKDCVLKYEEGGEIHQVAIMNSMNAHQGAFWYQVNYVLTIHETKGIGTDFGDALLDLW